MAKSKTIFNTVIGPLPVIGLKTFATMINHSLAMSNIVQVARTVPYRYDGLNRIDEPSIQAITVPLEPWKMAGICFARCGYIPLIKRALQNSGSVVPDYKGFKSDIMAMIHNAAIKLAQDGLTPTCIVRISKRRYALLSQDNYTFYRTEPFINALRGHVKGYGALVQGSPNFYQIIEINK